MKEVLIATNNAHKVEEIRTALNFEGWTFTTLAEAGVTSDPAEDADSFEGNARIKARAARAAARESLGRFVAVLADDSGLEVDALDGAPGVFSARYAGPDGDDAANNAKLLAIKDALRKSNPVILEPVMAVEVETPEEYTGFVMGDIPSRRGLIQGQEQRGNAVVIEAKVPLGNMFGYATDLRSGTQGRAVYTMQMDSYEPVPKSVQDEIISKAGGNA